MIKKLNSAKAISFDVETTSLDEIAAQLVGICLAVEPPTSYYIPSAILANAAQATSGQMALLADEPTLADGQLPPAKSTRRPCVAQSDVPNRPTTPNTITASWPITAWKSRPSASTQ
ncbi:MAG: hypothetical protein H6669_16040 [Ardenticatenaceae bacterium]|nr:hypothetical protein [Ardenticatenaceae bacterium]